MTQQVTAFKAQENVYKFVNRFELPFLATLPFPVFGEVNLKTVIYGLCGGMCFGTLDYFNAHKAVPDYQQPEQVPFNYEVYL